MFDYLKSVDLSTLRVVASGKTKTFFEIPGSSDLLLMVQKDVLTVNNGLTIMKVPEIGEYKAIQNDIIQRFLARHGIPTSYIQKIAPNRAICNKSAMIALEMVERNDSAKNGSWADRNPGAEFPKDSGVSEIFDKRTIVTGENVSFFMEEGAAAKKYGKSEHVHADPFIKEVYGNSGEYLWEFYDQHKPITRENLLMTDNPAYSQHMVDLCKGYSKEVIQKLTQGLLLAGKKLGLNARLIDDKTEYGIPEGRRDVVLSDDLTADAFRMEVTDRFGNAHESSKQVFRDLVKRGASEEEIVKTMPEVYKRTTDIIAGLDDLAL